MTTPTTTSYDELKINQSQLIRKALEGSYFTADPPTAITAGTCADLVELPLATRMG